jgi:general nucleoside transport system permease protein
MPELINALPLAIVAATPLLLAVEGELVVQRSGIINLSVEGMLLAAAFGATVAASATSSIALGILGGIAGAAVVGAIFGLFTIEIGGDQIVTGTAMNLLTLGVTGLAYSELTPSAPPVLGSGVITPLAWLVIPLIVAGVLWRTTLGLRLRASGENPEAVAAAGWSPALYRWIALGIESALVGIGGAHLALALSNGFAENMSAGRGFIALAVVIFGRWKLRGAIIGTALFGITAALQYALQAADRGVPFHLLLATPYVVTLLILCGVAGRVRAPEWLGRR